MAKPEDLQRLAHQLRIHSIKATTASKSGHPTSCSSMAEIISVLFFHTMRFKVDSPKDPVNDRFVLSKGHAAPILYAAWAEAGLFPKEDLMNLRKIDSDLEGHPTPRLNFIDVGTGSLGQGLSVACGMAYMGKNIDKAPYRVYCLLGDGEAAEGQIWEAIHFACFYKLDNLCIILDANKLGQTRETQVGHNMDLYKKRAEAFGGHALCIDGHNISELIEAFNAASNKKDAPTFIFCKTQKGKYFPGIEGEQGWHGKALGDKTDDVLNHLKSLINGCDVKLSPVGPCKSINVPAVNIKNIKLSGPPCYKKTEPEATRVAYGTALCKIMETCDRVIVLDADMSNSTYTNKAMDKFPDRFIECYIAEQNMISVAQGIICRDRAVAFASTFGSFLSRAFDQLRMGVISMTNINVCGSHAGCSIGEDGPSQMALEDLAMFRSLPGSTVFYPSDAVATERAVELAANTPGICYIRTTRPATPILYKMDQEFQIGKGNVIKESNRDCCLVIAGGITMDEAIKAYTKLKCKGLTIRIFDLFTIKPIDACGIVKNAQECKNKIVTVEDHYPEGGIGEAVLSAIAGVPNILVRKMAVTEVPRSGPPAAVMDKFGISCDNIVKVVTEFAGDKDVDEKSI